MNSPFMCRTLFGANQRGDEGVAMLMNSRRRAEGAGDAFDPVGDRVGCIIAIATDDVGCRPTCQEFAAMIEDEHHPAVIHDEHRRGTRCDPSG